MKCELCKKEATINLNKHFCNKCFFRVIQKRIRKYVRMNKLFKPKDKLVIKDELTYNIIKDITKDMPLTIKRQKTPKAKIITKWTMDDEINVFLNNFLLNKPTKKTTYIKPLIIITDKEATTLAKIKKIRFIPNKKTELWKAIDKFSEKYPDTKYNLIKSIKALNK